MSAEVYENAERTFLTPKGATEGEKSNVPSLDEFDNEIDIYRVCNILFGVTLIVTFWVGGSCYPKVSIIRIRKNNMATSSKVHLSSVCLMAVHSRILLDLG